MKTTNTEAAVPATEFHYGIDVGPMFNGFPEHACFWLGFEWQPNLRLWMAHTGRQNRFCLVSPRTLKSLLREARRNELVVAAYRQQKT